MSKRKQEPKNEAEGLPHDIWRDPNVQAALKEGRSASDIMVLRCPECNEFGYYNEGSHFTCRFCDLSYYCLTENESKPEGCPSLRLDESDCVTLADTVTETTEGYDNRTQ